MKSTAKISDPQLAVEVKKSSEIAMGHVAKVESKEVGGQGAKVEEGEVAQVTK